MRPCSGPTVLGRWLCFGLDCAQSTTFVVRWHHETGGAADEDRHRHQGLCSCCCYCMEQTTNWHSNLYVHCAVQTFAQKLKTFYASRRVWGFLFCAVEIDSLLLLLLLLSVNVVWCMQVSGVVFFNVNRRCTSCWNAEIPEGRNHRKDWY